MKKKASIQNLETTEIKRFSPSPDFGLSENFVAQRKSEGLVNTTDTKYSKSYLNIFINNFCTFFNLLGLVVLISLILIKAPLSKYGFVVIYIANILIGLIQEIRAKKCIDKLTLVAAKPTKVIRDGKEIQIMPQAIVLDDVIILGLGSQIPTDSIIIEGNIEVNESLLTGESVPVKKNKGDELLAGSFIVGGTCKVLANKVGKNNYVNTLSEKAKKYKKPNSEIMSTLKGIIKVISAIIIPITVAHILRFAVFEKADLDVFIPKTSALVLGMIPSGMFLLTSMALAIGIIKLARHNTLVQDLYSLEMLARVDTICFDKTGTITDGKMNVKELVSLSNYNVEQLKNILSSMLFSLKDNNQTAIALCNAFGQNSYFSAVETIPFSSERKLSAVTFANKKTYAFGAPEFVLSKEIFSKIEKEINQYARLGYRVLIVGESGNEIINGNPPKDFMPIALIVLVDNIRDNAPLTVKWFIDNEVEIKVISGDNPITVSEVSKRVGVPNADKFISLEGLSDEEVYKIATEYTIFGRVSPEQKSILVKALKDAGHTTAMTGDGVNDILALKEADCAISVASGAEAARNVSHIVLLDNDFNSMPQIVHEGRRVINNVKGSSSLYLMKTFFTMILSVIALFYDKWQGYPFEINHLYLLEVFIIGLPSFFLSLQPNNARVKGNFLAGIIEKSLPSSILMIISVVIVEIFKNFLHAFPDDVYLTMEVYAFTFTGLICLFNICSPMNLYRAILFIFNFVIITVITVHSIENGFEFLSFVKMWPFEKYWHHLLINLCIILVDIPLLFLINKLFEKIHLSLAKNKVKKNMKKDATK